MGSKTNSRFEVGDWVVHYFHGIGKVKEIVNKGLDGNEKTFYKVSTKEIDYWIPLEDENADHIEPIRSKKKFADALKLLASAPEPIAEHHKTRKKKIYDRWRDGDLSSRAKLMRDLNGRLKLEKLSFSEKEMLKKVKNYFINEWIISDDTLSRQQAKKQLRKALKSGVRKAKQTDKIKESEQ